jgi:hypothetical protein
VIAIRWAFDRGRKLLAESTITPLGPPLPSHSRNEIERCDGQAITNSPQQPPPKHREALESTAPHRGDAHRSRRCCPEPDPSRTHWTR